MPAASLLLNNIAGGTFPLIIVFVLFSACVCRRPSWTPKTQPGGSSAACCLLVEFLVFNSISHVIKNAAWPGSCRTGSYVKVFWMVTLWMKLNVKLENVKFKFGRKFETLSYEPVRHDPGHDAFFKTCEIELNTKNSTRRQQSCLLVEFLVFNSAFGRHRH